MAAAYAGMLNDSTTRTRGASSPRGGALAEDDSVGDLLHLQMPPVTVVLSAEHVEEGVGLGMVGGNLLGGRFADRALMPMLYASPACSLSSRSPLTTRSRQR